MGISLEKFKSRMDEDIVCILIDDRLDGRYAFVDCFSENVMPSPDKVVKYTIYIILTGESRKKITKGNYIFGIAKEREAAACKVINVKHVPHYESFNPDFEDGPATRVKLTVIFVNGEPKMTFSKVRQPVAIVNRFQLLDIDAK